MKLCGWFDVRRTAAPPPPTRQHAADPGDGWTLETLEVLAALLCPRQPSNVCCILFFGYPCILTSLDITEEVLSIESGCETPGRRTPALRLRLRILHHRGLQ